MVAEFINASTGQPVTLELRGDFWGGSGDIAWDGRVVAQITRDVVNMREIFTNNQTVSEREFPPCQNSPVPYALAIYTGETEESRGRPV